MHARSQIFVSKVFFGVLILCLANIYALGQIGPCVRYTPGSVVAEPPSLYSYNGQLTVNFSYNTGTDARGNTLYCFLTVQGQVSPTIHVKPGDWLYVNVKNNLPTPTSAQSMHMDMPATGVCGAPAMDASSVNIHYHGTNVRPACHSDEVIHTLINSGQTFSYSIYIPADEPPGLYWYHPHVHTLSESAVLGGASGALIVDGIENLQPAVAGLAFRTFLVRDQLVPSSVKTPPPPGWDLSLNYIPIPFPNYPPAIIQMQAGEKQFWRVANASADTIIDVQLQYDGVPQTLYVVALDGVPTGSQVGTGQGTLVPKTDILIPPAARAEFIMQGPATTVTNASFMTLNVPTGRDGDNDPTRPLATIQTNSMKMKAAVGEVSSMPAKPGKANPQRFVGLAKAQVTATRSLYFSEDNPNSKFYITVYGATPTLFNPNNPPSIITTTGAVEDWTVQNQSYENHEFHIHQIHFLLLQRNGVPVPTSDSQFLDTIDIPAWTGSGPYPSVTVRMDFRGNIFGDFVYHCHILEHEDDGMMAIIRVLPPYNKSGKAAKHKPAKK